MRLFRPVWDCETDSRKVVVKAWRIDDVQKNIIATSIFVSGNFTARKKRVGSACLSVEKAELFIDEKSRLFTASENQAGGYHPMRLEFG
ncbi:hypothetical protein [Paracoccus sp. SCSIO 75233]|uniref:hypothetical protein n=1 Tax=Paracoccus sp. SCSIO 75233 TaxID=3017782 RepID=UPI0022F08C40|nr:hypothetical protein [Paracoccus sp. SCSIO 75233]WBU52075.1 hypothetical protein PAF12_09500 [Paracoccus sp. SCSIO 75233]